MEWRTHRCLRINEYACSNWIDPIRNTLHYKIIHHVKWTCIWCDLLSNWMETHLLTVRDRPLHPTVSFVCFWHVAYERTHKHTNALHTFIKWSNLISFNILRNEKKKTEMKTINLLQCSQFWIINWVNILFCIFWLVR